MALIDQDPASETNGPDKNRFTPKCWRHHSGQRTGIKDYCCCCDPCLYRTVEDSVEANPHCCRCNPRVIVAKYTVDSGDCENQIMPMFGEKTVDDDQNTVVHYQASFLGRTVHVWLSTLPIPNVSYDSNEYINCRWTIYIPSLGIVEEVEIDHENVTCLGVPDIEISGVTSAGGECTGTITLENFETDKVEFQLREFPETFPDGEGTTVDLYLPCGDCVEVARFLCLSGVRHKGADAEWVEFEWDVDFEPHEEGDQYIHGKWSYTPPVETPFVEHIYLITSGGYCELHFDFESPVGRELGEEIEPISISNCSCNINEFVSAGTPQEPIGFTIRAGRCSCWEYHCGTCRCVPRYLCGLYFVDQTLYKNIRFTWSSAIKGWVSSGGEDRDGNPFEETLTVLLEKDEFGNCVIDGSPVSCGLVMSATISTLATEYSPATWLYVSTAFAECDYRIVCGDATPCDEHPAVLNMYAVGYNDPYEDEPGIEGDCPIEIPLFYFSEVFLVGETGPNAIEINCGYRGIWDWESEGGTPFRSFFELQGGVLEVNVTNLLTGGSAASESFSLDYEYCDPYIAEYFAITGLTSCIWGSATIQRILIEITE